MRSLNLLRVSTRSEDQKDSPENQARWYRGEVERLGWTDIGSVEDRQTGKDVLQRPGIQRVIELAAAGAFDVLCARDVDRFHRNDLDFLLMERAYLEPRGIKLYYSGGFLSEDTSSDFITKRILYLMSTFQSKLQGEKIRSGLRAGRERGKVGYKAPVGMLRRGDGWLIPDPDHAPLYLEMVERRERGEPYADIAAALRDRWQGRQGGLLHPNTVRQILTNPTFAGRVMHGGRALDVDAQIEAVIDYDRWQRIQPTPRTPRGRTPNPGGYMLTGDRLLCPAWLVGPGHRLAGSEMPMRGRQSGTANLYRYTPAYRIRSSHVPAVALSELAEAVPSLRCADIDRHITALVLEHWLSIIGGSLRDLPRNAEVLEAPERFQLRGMRGELDKAQRRFDNAVELGYAADAARYDGERTRLQAEIDALEAADAQRSHPRASAMIRAADVLAQARELAVLPPALAQGIRWVRVMPVDTDGRMVRLKLTVGLSYSFTGEMHNSLVVDVHYPTLTTELVVCASRQAAPCTRQGLAANPSAPRRAARQ